MPGAGQLDNIRATPGGSIAETVIGNGAETLPRP